MHSEEFVRGFPTPFEILYLLEGYQLPLKQLKEGCPIHVKKRGSLSAILLKKIKF
jgi:hypothetical protein